MASWRSDISHHKKIPQTLLGEIEGVVQGNFGNRADEIQSTGIRSRMNLMRATPAPLLP